MNRIFPAVNLVFVLTIGVLIILSVRVWTHPPYPFRVDITSLNVAPKKFEPLSIEKPEYEQGTIAKLVQSNLFRKERKEYVPPPPPPPPSKPVVQEPALPLPDLVLKGVLLLGDTRVAILEGIHFIMKNRRFIEEKVKKKGYSLGDLVGGFKLEKIEKASVTLRDPRGREVKVRLAKNAPGRLDLRKKASKKLINAPRMNRPNQVKPNRHPFKRPKVKSQDAPGSAPSPAPVFHVSGAPSSR